MHTRTTAGLVGYTLTIMGVVGLTVYMAVTAPAPHPYHEPLYVTPNPFTLSGALLALGLLALILLVVNRFAAS